MNEQETEAVEQAIRRLAQTIVDLTAQRRDIDFRIEELEKIKSALTRLLPTDKRIEKLFN